jgi:chemotaxis protein methyltransferase CheR
MTAIAAQTPIERAAFLVEAALGLHFPPSRHADLERGLRAAASELGLQAFEECLELLRDQPVDRVRVELLASHLTVGETYFFREKGVFAALEQEVLPQLIRARAGERRLRVWSAGCCTGEEPYSLAILLNRLLPDRDSWNAHILASDINPNFLRKAAQAVYGRWSFRDVPDEIREQCFRSWGRDRFELLPAHRQRVTFAHLNLAEDAYPSLLTNTNAMDLILCRNVLMYFSGARMREVITRLHACLVDGGWLVVSPTEVSHELFRQFRAVPLGGVVLYRKDPAPAVRFVATPAAVPEGSRAAPVPGHGRALPPDKAKSRRPAERPRARPAPVDDGDSLLEHATRFFEQGRCGEAEAQLDSLLASRPADGPALLLRTRIRANAGRLDDALECCDRAIAVLKLDARAHHLRAVILEELNRFADAEASLQRAVYLDPDFALAHFGLGQLALRREKSAAARKHFANTAALLGKLSPGEPLSSFDGLTAGRLAEILHSTEATMK